MVARAIPGIGNIAAAVADKTDWSLVPETAPAGRKTRDEPLVQAKSKQTGRQNSNDLH